MENLNKSTLILRTLTPKEYTQLIDDLNYNFMSILNLPGFKGIQGDSIQGLQGIGIRGSKWIFLQLQDVAEYYDLTDYTQINLDWVNRVYNDNPERFFSTLYIPNDTGLLLGDVIVLPDGSIITLSEVVDSSGDEVVKFVDTGITFNDVTSVSESRVIEIFQNLYSQANTGLGASRHYNAVAKNATDASPHLNTQVNVDSAVDIVTSLSGVGAPLSDYTFLGTSETAVNTTTQLCLLVGSSTVYHRLVQATQGSWNNDYVAGVDDFAGLIVLQNNDKNGIIFGNKNNNNLRRFGRLYSDSTSTILTSSYSPTASEFSNITLSDTVATIRSLKATINTKTTEILSENFKSDYLNWDSGQAYFGHEVNKKLWIGFNQGVYLRNIKNANVLSTNKDGKIVSTYKVITDFDERSDTSLITSKSIWDELVDIRDDLSGIGSIDNSIDEVIYRNRYEATINNNRVSISNLIEHGTHAIPKSVIVTDRIGGRTNAILANDALISSQRWSDEAVNYEYILQKMVVRSPMFVPVGSTYQNFIGTSNYRTEYNKNIDHVLIRRGYRSRQANVNTFTFSDWSWELNETSMFNIESDDAIEISGDLTNNNLKLSHKEINTTTPNLDNPSIQQVTDLKVVKDVTTDRFGHVSSKRIIDLSNHFISKNSGGIGELPWGSFNGDTVKEAIEKMIGELTPRVISLPLMSLSATAPTSVWSNIKKMADANLMTDSNYHNVVGHDVQWRLAERVSNRSTILVRMRRTDSNKMDWGKDYATVTSLLFNESGNSHTALYGGTLSDSSGGWTTHKLNIHVVGVISVAVGVKLTLTRF